MVRFYIWLLQQVYLICIKPRSYMVIYDDLRGDWLSLASTEVVNSQVWYCQGSLEYKHFYGMRIWGSYLVQEQEYLGSIFSYTQNTQSHGKWFPRHCPFVRRIYQLLVNFPQKGTALMLSSLPRTSCWTDSWFASDLKHHGTHVTSLHCLFGIFSADVVSPWFSSSHGFSVRPLHYIDFLEAKSSYDWWRYQQASLGRNTDCISSKSSCIQSKLDVITYPCHHAIILLNLYFVKRVPEL